MDQIERFLMSGCWDMDLSKTLKWRDGNANANADAKVSTIALPVLCTGELNNYQNNSAATCIDMMQQKYIF